MPGSGSDPLYEAWEALRLARQVPWSAQGAGGWRAAFQRHISRAGELVRAHVEQADSPEVAAIARPAEGSASLRRRQLDDHPALLQQLHELIKGLEASSPGDVHSVVECNERAALIEIRVAMHQNRLHELLAQNGAGALRRRDARVPELARRA